MRGWSQPVECYSARGPSAISRRARPSALAFGLAPETVEAFFIQRLRWARGAIQILYLANGPFGRGLTLMQRLLYLPMHWLMLGPKSLIIILAPIVFLWTGISPVFDVSVAD